RRIPCRVREGFRAAERMAFTPEAKRALEKCFERYLALKSISIGPEHLLLGLLDVKDCPGYLALVKLNVNPEALRASLLEEIQKRSSGN
ncbi:MAG: Clp protease N-terminal domain-containing protein, partial [Candidatus Saccharimonadales bacterium]